MALASFSIACRGHGEVRAGDQTVHDVCSMCHASGLMGAPRIGDSSAWRGRLDRAGSVDRLAASAAKGRGEMPPRGGEPVLSREDLKAAIEYMLDRSGISAR